MEIRLKSLIEWQKIHSNPITSTADQLIIKFNIALFDLFDSLDMWKFEKPIISDVDETLVFYNYVELLMCFTSLLIKTEDLNLMKNENSIASFEEELQKIYEILSAEKQDIDKAKLVSNWIVLIGTDNETGHTTATTQRMGILTYLMSLVLTDFTWESVELAFMKEFIL
jgi:hypothetical protein